MAKYIKKPVVIDAFQLNERGLVERRVTHWMPLPEPPKECE